METEKLNELIEEFIDDLAIGRHPRIYALLDAMPELREEIESELALVLALRNEPMPIPAERAARILAKIFESPGL